MIVILIIISTILTTSLILEYFIGNSLISLSFILSLITCSIITTWAIPKLKSLKLKQIIREEGPKQHRKKAGTLTEGGVLIVPAGLICANLLTLNQIQDSKEKEILN